MPKKVDKLVSDIKRLMEHAEDWEKKRTSIPGLWLVKMPDKSLRVMLMFNPPDMEGNPTRKKSWWFADSEIVGSVRTAFGDKRLDDVVAAVEKVNGESGKKPPEEGDVFEV